MSAFWWIVSAFVLVAYAFVLFRIVADVFRDTEMSGFVKAVWIVALIFLPFITVVVYLLVHGHGMTARTEEMARQAKAQTDAYVRNVAGTGPAQEIAKAKELLDAGTIDEGEFVHLKNRALTEAQRRPPGSQDLHQPH